MSSWATVLRPEAKRDAVLEGTRSIDCGIKNLESSGQIDGKLNRNIITEAPSLLAPGLMSVGGLTCAASLARAKADWRSARPGAF